MSLSTINPSPFKKVPISSLTVIAVASTLAIQTCNAMDPVSGEEKEDSNDLNLRYGPSSLPTDESTPFNPTPLPVANTPSEPGPSLATLGNQQRTPYATMLEAITADAQRRGHAIETGNQLAEFIFSSLMESTTDN